MISKTEAAGLILVVLGVFAWSAVGPYDRTTWGLMVTPILAAFPVLAFVSRRFPITRLLYRLMAMHAVIVLVGAHYSYSRVPAGAWVQQLAGFSRNHYDRFSYFFQGIVVAMVAREIMLRRTPLQPDGWMFVMVSAVATAYRACYEILDWWAAETGRAQLAAFLGREDLYGPQWHLAVALGGSLLAQVLLARKHNRHLTRLFVDSEGRGFILDAKGGRRGRRAKDDGAGPPPAPAGPPSESPNY